MKYRLRSDGSLKTQGELRNMHKTTSLPKVWKEATLDFLGVDPVFQTPKPHTNDLQSATLNGAIEDSKGNWVENWEIKDKFHDYTDDDGNLVTKSEQEIEYLTKINTDRLKSKKDLIRDQAEESFKIPVTLPDGSVWNGGMDSALAIDGAVRMAENAGLTQISLYDSDNTEHVVDINTGKSVAAAIGSDYQTKFAAKQSAMNQLNNIDLSTVTAKDEIEAVTL